MSNTNKRDLTDMRFNNLVAKEPTSERFNRYVVWSCLCDCGEYTNVPSRYLKSKQKKDCGCGIYKKLKNPHKNMQAKPKNSHKNRYAFRTLRHDLSNNTYGLLKVIRPTEYRNHQGSIMYECECKCGEITLVSASNLLSGQHSCGCLQRQKSSRGNNGAYPCVINGVTKYRSIVTYKDINYYFGTFDNTIGAIARSNQAKEIIKNNKKDAESCKNLLLALKNNSNEQ